MNVWREFKMENEKLATKKFWSITKICPCFVLSFIMVISYFGVVPAFAQANDSTIQKAYADTNDDMKNSQDQASDPEGNGNAIDEPEDQAPGSEADDNAVDESTDQASTSETDTNATEKQDELSPGANADSNTSTLPKTTKEDEPQRGSAFDSTWVWDGWGWRLWNPLGWWVTNDWAWDGDGWSWLDGNGYCIEYGWAWLYDSSGWNWYFFINYNIIYYSWQSDSGGSCFLDGAGHALCNASYWEYLPPNTWMEYRFDSYYHYYMTVTWHQSPWG